MNPFEAKEIRDPLRDANDLPIDVPPVPDAGMLEELTIETVQYDETEPVQMITNFPEEIGEEEEGWRFSDVPSEVTKITVEKVMVDLTGTSWFGNEREEGYSVTEVMEQLSQKAFVQLSELTEANVKACLEQDGKIIAYFPDLVWREYFGQLPTIPAEVLGMRTVEIEEVTESNRVVVNDLSSANGGKQQLDMTSFTWLSKDGWMLEVYK